MRLFVVDDSAPLRERIVRLLAGVQGTSIVGQASNGVEAVIGIHESKPDLVILDLQIPRGTGLEILPEVKKNVPVPIVMILTNYATTRHREACTRLGADYFFDKSTEFEKAISVIEHLADAACEGGIIR